MNKGIESSCQPKSRDREVLSLIVELSKAVRCCRQDEVFCEGITLTQFVILDAVSAGRKMGMASLHEALGVDKSTTTRLITPLVARGLLSREKADHDSRAATLQLTPQGEQVHADVWQCLLSFLRGIEKQIPKDGRREALNGARTFLNALQKVSLMRCEGGPGQDGCGCGEKKRGRAGRAA
jgi:DNA-binding MarR family transcriptional regulator